MFPTLTKWNGLPGLLMPIAVKPNRASATWEPEHHGEIASAPLPCLKYSSLIQLRSDLPLCNR